MKQLMELMLPLGLRGRKRRELQDDDRKDKLTERLDARGALKDGVGDFSLLEEGTEDETTNTGSNNKHIWLDFSCHLFWFVSEKKGVKSGKWTREMKMRR